MKTATEFLELNHNNTTDMLDDFAKQNSVGFGVFISTNNLQTSKDGWWMYKNNWLTTDELYNIYLELSYER